MDVEPVAARMPLVCPEIREALASGGSSQLAEELGNVVSD
jgi:hypothetical protein